MKRLMILPVVLAALLGGGAVRIVQDQCGPFTDVTPAFCPYILELYYLGITAGTSATTFSPDDPLTRGQGAVFIAKGLNQSLARSSRRAALGQWWTPDANGVALSTTHPADTPVYPQSDGADLWIPVSYDHVERVRSSDLRGLDGWSGAPSAYATLVAMGRVFVTGNLRPGRLFMIDPTQPSGPVTTVASDLGDNPAGIAFDGARIWTANSGGSVSIVTPASAAPFSVTTVASGFSSPSGIVFDGHSVWVTDLGLGVLLKLDANGAILQTIPTGPHPGFPTFDGENLWVPDAVLQAVTVVRASTGEIVATLTGNGLAGPLSAAFDGQRVLIAGSSLSLWRAADLSPLGSVDVSAQSQGAIVGVCSDGIDFFVTFLATNGLARF